MIRALPMICTLLSACGGEKSGVDAPPESDADGPGEFPDDGCITINGSGGFESIADALDWADEGDTISLCSGTYSERVVVNKGNPEGPNIRGSGDHQQP